jgi:hypothetical protein
VGSSAQGITATEDAFGISQFGHPLGGSASVSYNITGTPKLALDAGQGEFQDVITLSFGPLNGDPGLLYVLYDLHGSISTTGNGHAFSEVFIAGGNTDQNYVFNYTSSTSGLFALPKPLSFTYGQPFDLYMAIEAVAGTVSLSGNAVDFVNTVGKGSGSADFSNTLTLTGLIPTDLNGDTVTGATFSSVSGTEYSIKGIVPEPISGALFFVGLLVICFCMNRQSLGKPSKYLTSTTGNKPAI